jgi:hypothetical protein
MPSHTWHMSLRLRSRGMGKEATCTREKNTNNTNTNNNKKEECGREEIVHASKLFSRQNSCDRCLVLVLLGSGAHSHTFTLSHSHTLMDRHSTCSTAPTSPRGIRPFDELVCLRQRSDVVIWKLEANNNNTTTSASSCSTTSPLHLKTSKRKFSSLRSIRSSSNKKRRTTIVDLENAHPIDDVSDTSDTCSDPPTTRRMTTLKATPMSPSQGIGLANLPATTTTTTTTRRHCRAVTTAASCTPSNKPLEQQFRLLYSQVYCASCADMRSFLHEHQLEAEQKRDAIKKPIGASEAIAICRSLATVIVAKVFNICSC